MPKHAHDKHDLHTVLTDFPKQFEQGLELGKNATVASKPAHVLVAGMGGSALAADLLNTYLRGELILQVSRDYGVPHWVAKDTLVFCISYSGNTEETVESFLDARDRGAQIVVVCAGGELARLAAEHHVPLITVPGGLQPRCATGYVFGALIAVLMNAGLADKSHAKHIATMVAELAGMEFEKEAERLAQELKNHVPVIYASDRFASIARTWKIKINENVKTLAFHNSFPEMNHNELESFANLTMKPYLIFLRNTTDHARVQRRMEITREIMSGRGIQTHEITMQGSTILTQMFSALLLGDWVSYYLAREYEVDPTPVAVLEEFKKRMKE